MIIISFPRIKSKRSRKRNIEISLFGLIYPIIFTYRVSNGTQLGNDLISSGLCCER